MKKNLGYLVIIIIGVLSVFSLMLNNESVNKSVAKHTSPAVYA